MFRHHALFRSLKVEKLTQPHFTHICRWFFCAKSRYPLIDLTLHEGGEYGNTKVKAVAGRMVDCDMSEAEELAFKRCMMDWDDDEDQDEGAF